VLVNRSPSTVLRRLLVTGANRTGNYHAMLIFFSDGSLVEDNEIYEFHRYGISVYGGRDITLRRNYVNSRNYPDLVSGYVSTDPATGDTGIRVTGVARGRIENNLAEANAEGFTLTGSDWGPAENLPDSGEDNLIVGSIAAYNSNDGFRINSSCDGADPCLTGHLTRPRIESSVSFANDDDAFVSRGSRQATFVNLTALMARSTSFRFDLAPQNATMTDASYLVENGLDVGVGGTSYLMIAPGTWTIRRVNAFGRTTAFSPDASDVTEASSVDPLLGGCVVYIPPGSPMKGAGLGGADIGANIVFRTVDGVQTGTRLWDASTGAFPCGAVIPGVNDDPATSCIGAHTRLNIGTGGCPIP
jgi:parallel beta-helix repeat protein